VTSVIYFCVLPPAFRQSAPVFLFRTIQKQERSESCGIQLHVFGKHGKSPSEVPQAISQPCLIGLLRSNGPMKKQFDAVDFGKNLWYNLAWT